MAYTSKARGPQIKASSKYDGLTLSQMAQINEIINQHTGPILSKQDIGRINSILATPGTASQKMGAIWTPMQMKPSAMMEIPDKNNATDNRIFSANRLRKVADESVALGMVTFTDLTAMGRSDYGENSYLKPQYVKSRDDLKQRAIVFTQISEQPEPGVYRSRILPMQVNKKLVVDTKTNAIQADVKEPWVYEPWSQTQFVKSPANDASNRHLYQQIIPGYLSEDISLQRWIDRLPMGRRQKNKLITESGLSLIEGSTRDGHDLTGLNTTNLSREVANAADSVMAYLQNNGFTYTLESTEYGTIRAKVNTGSGQYNVTVLNLRNPYDAKSIGNVNGNGLSISVDRTVNSKTAKGVLRKEYNVDAKTISDPVGPLKVITGQSDVVATKFNVDKLENVTHEDYVNGSHSRLKTSIVYTKADGKRALVDINRNGLVLDSDKDADVSLDEMIVEVNERLQDSGLEPVHVDVENEYAGLPLSAISQLYSRETVINALLAKGIDAEKLRDPKYDGDVHIGFADLLKPLPAEAFSDENVNRINDLLAVDSSVKNLDIDDLRVLREISDLDADVLQQANQEFYKRIGYHESVDIENDAEDAKEVSQEVVPLKQSLISAMAGRYANNQELAKHLRSTADYSETEAKWLNEIKTKIGSRVGIEAPTSDDPKAWQEYQEQMKRVRVSLDDQHVVHWYVTSKDNPKRLARNGETGLYLQGKIGQLFLPDKNGLIDLDYTGGSKGYAVAGYNAYFVSPEEQLKLMRREVLLDKKQGKAPRWSNDEMDYQFLKSEDSLAYRVRLSGFDEELDKRLDQLLTRQITLGIDDTLGDNVMLNRLYKGKDTYLTRITNDISLTDEKMQQHLASRVYIDDSYFSEAGNELLGRHVDKKGNLVDLAAKYTPDSLSGVLFDQKDIAGLGNSHYLSGKGLELLQNKATYDKGRFMEHFQAGSELQKDLKLNPQKRFGILLNEDENKYQHSDPIDRVFMATAQQLHADSYVPDTNLALMTFKGYTMDDGSLITEAYAERVGREQAQMVADNRIKQGNFGSLLEVVNADKDVAQRLSASKFPTVDEYQNAVKDAFIEKMATTPTTEGGYKLVAGDKLSTFHGNKTTISHVITPSEMQPGQTFETFGQNPHLEVAMPPESIISRLNMGEVQQLMDGDVKPIHHNGETVGYSGTTTMINTEIKAAHKTHVYEHGDGRHVGAQLLWMLRARPNSDTVIDKIYGDNGAAAYEQLQYMELSGQSVDFETGIISNRLAHSDADLGNDEYLAEHDIQVIDPTQLDEDNRTLPINGGYIKLPVPIHLPMMDDDQTTSYLPVLPEALRKGQELPSGEILDQDRTRRYNQIIDIIAEGKGDQLVGSRNNKQPLLQSRVDTLTQDVVRSKLGAADGSTNKTSHIRREVMGATVSNSATAVATNNPTLDLDTIEVGPDVYKNLNIKSPDQKVMMWRDPALHAGSVMAMKVKLNPDITGVGMNPVLATPFGGDFDGDTYGIYSPGNDQEIQKIMTEEYSVEAYLQDMGKKVEDRKFVQTDVELNTGMDFTAGAVAGKVKNSAGEEIKNKGMLEDELRTILERGAYEEDSNIAKDITQLWRQSQEHNIGADKIDLINRDRMQKSMIDIAEKGAKGKVAGLQSNMDRFDRLGYYDSVTKNHVYDHDEQGHAMYDAKIRDNVHAVVQKRYAANKLDGVGKKSVLKDGALYSTVAKADREIEKATVAKQELTASSGQSAIDLNKIALDIKDTRKLGRISEMTQLTTQAALQVKHNAEIVPSLNQGISTISKLNTQGGESYDEFLKNRQEIYANMSMPEGYSRTFATAAYESVASDVRFGDTAGDLSNVQDGVVSEYKNTTKSKGEVTEASAPLALMSYNGAKYNKQLAKSQRSIYEGVTSGKLVQALIKERNKHVPEVDRLDERIPTIANVYYEKTKSVAQSQNRQIRDESIQAQRPLVKDADLAAIRPKATDVKKVVQSTVNTLDNVDEKIKDLSIDEAVDAQMGRVVPLPKVTMTVPTKTHEQGVDLDR